MKNFRKGFTLLEILLVIGIIAVLVGIVIVAINPSKTLATVRNTERKSDLKQIDSALSQYYIDNNEYPASLTSVSSLTEICDTGTASATTTAVNGELCDDLINLSELVPKYLTAIPTDPSATTTSRAGYKIIRTGKKIGLSAPAELNQTITIGTVPTVPVVVDACSHVATDPDCWSTKSPLNLGWGPRPSTTGVSTSTLISNGRENTAILYGISTTLYPAAKYCYELTEGGVPVGTWYLPSYAELWAGWGPPGVGGFPSGAYWSSTEDVTAGIPEYVAWALSSDWNEMSGYDKLGWLSVRCLR